MNEFIQRLKQRKLVQWTVAYVAAAFALLQGIDIIANRFDLPSQTMRLVIFAMVVGFFVTLVLAWYHGERGAQRVNGTELLILTLLLAIGGGLLWRFAAASPEQVVRPATAAAPVAEKSIAVLPFANLSEDKANAYFAEGVQDEILTRLAKIADLKVISRTSTQRFKSAPENLPEIARQLGVAHILEGSVQKSAGQVRVNVQLIHAQSDAHLWADTFDRKLTDIFAVESEIAQAIAETLQAKLTGSEQRAIAVRPTQDTEAHQLYLKGRFFWNKRTGPDLMTALDYFQQAILADPKYAAAYAGVADSCILIPFFSAGAPREYFPRAKAAARRALELDENLAEAHTAAAQLLCNADLNPEAAARAFERAIQLNPNYATAHHWYGNSVLVALGRFDQALAEMKRAVELDPLSRIINADVGNTLIIARRYDEAIASLRRTLALDDKFAYTYWNLGEAFYQKGDLREAIVQYEKGIALNRDFLALGALGRCYALAGEKEKALAIQRELTEASQRTHVPRFSLATLSIGLGEKAAAIEYLEQAYQNQETNDLTWLKVDPALDPLRAEPRFQQFVAKVFPEKSR